jgi:hypothetical protein
MLNNPGCVVAAESDNLADYRKNQQNECMN